jgi:uncharacterized protein YxjI
VSADPDPITAVDLPAGEYEIRQSLVRNKYAVYGPDGDLVLRGSQKRFRMKEEFPFEDADGNPVFRVKAASILDVAGDYAIEDGETGREVATLSKNFTFLTHSWTVKSPDGEVWAEVRSASRLLMVLRNVSGLASLLPHRYVVSDADGAEIGRIEGQFSVRDRYALRIQESDAPTEALVAACIAIDALEGN